MSDLILVAGSPGSGKTTLAETLACDLGIRLLSRDAIKEPYVRAEGKCHEELPDANLIATRAFFAEIEALLAGGPLIAEAAFQHAVWSKALARLPHATNLLLLHCRVSPELAARRDRERREADADWARMHGAQAVTADDVAAWEAPRLGCPTLEVDTSAGYDPPLETIKEWITERLTTA